MFTEKTRRQHFHDPKALSTRRQRNLNDGVFTLKTHLMFFIHSTPKKLENATITGHFSFAFEENALSHDYCDGIVLEKLLPF